MTELILFLKKWMFYALGASIILMLVFIKGCNYGKSRVKCPTIVTGTTSKPDTVTHHIYHIWPWYIEGKDSIVYLHDIVPAKIDTVEILKDYYSKHYSRKIWADSIIDVTLDMMITENRFFPQKFDYHIKRPQIITNNSIDNSVNYAHYLYIGGSVPVNDLKYASISLFYASQRALIGLGYVPALKGVQVTGGIKLLSFKK